MLGIDSVVLLYVRTWIVVYNIHSKSLCCKF